ncbi:MAG TPA: hypothetical protein VN832_07680 [Stellaceae bacterium]|nr:hypothetical protein [Stellaceae bacterium]
MRIGVSFAVAAAFWVLSFLVQKFNWGAGGKKALALLALLAAVPFLLRWARRPLTLPRSRTATGLAIVVAILVALQLAYFGKEVRHPGLIDVATTTLAAGTAMVAGENPYLLPLDSVAASNPATAAFAGYKYLPIMPLVYLPLGLPFGARGLLATNLLLQLGIVFLVARLAREAANGATGLLAATLYLAVPLAIQQVLAKGATDLAAVLPLLAALWLVERNSWLCGLALGLSIAAKPLPGLLLLPCLLPPRAGGIWRYAAGIAVGLLPILPYALWSPAALFDNVVRFNALRLPDSTSWLAIVPAGAAPARIALALLVIAVGAYVWRYPPALAGRAGLGAMVTLAGVLASPSAHHNYQLWWLPFYCVLLARAIMAAARDLPRPGEARYGAPSQGERRTSL